MKFNFSIETIIDKPLSDVIKLYTDRDQFPRWQPGLISQDKDQKSNAPRYKMLFQLGRRKMVITETILSNDLPARYTHQYVLKGMTHTLAESFASVNQNQTKWHSDIEYRFKGIMHLIARFMEANFRKQSTIMQQNFKRYCER